MGQSAPQYQGNIYLDGFTYRLSLRLYEQQQKTAAAVPHSHPQYELHVVFNGEVILEQEGFMPIVLHPGDCCIVPPLVYHLRRVGSDATSCCTLYIDSPKGAPLHIRKHECVNLACAHSIMPYMNTLKDELKNRQLGTDSSIQCLLTLLLVGMIRDLTKLAPNNFSTVAMPASQQREETIDNYFANHYGENISAGDLAAHIGVTTRQLARIMQQRYACTFRQHLLEIRLYHARQQLIHSEKSILQIANDCGFPDQGAFAAAFRKAVGCTPSQYRQQQRTQS